MRGKEMSDTAIGLKATWIDWNVATTTTAATATTSTSCPQKGQYFLNGHEWRHATFSKKI